MKKKDYLKPEIISVEVQTEKSMLAASGITGSGSDFEWDDDDNDRSDKSSYGGGSDGTDI